MLSSGAAQDQVRSRGPRFAVVGTIRRDEMQVVLVDTAAKAEEAAEKMRADELRMVRLHLPQSDLDYLGIGRTLHDARTALAEATEVARAAARRLVESGVSESETARQLGVDRMTVRAWLGKR
jgi:DNA invertase Pin-like site-specific DNA recombinase